MWVLQLLVRCPLYLAILFAFQGILHEEPTFDDSWAGDISLEDGFMELQQFLGHSLAHPFRRMKGHELDERLHSDHVKAVSDAEDGIAFRYHKKWWRSCSGVIKNRRDYVEYEQGLTCLDSCGNALAAQMLGLPVAKLLATLQSFVSSHTLIWGIRGMPHVVCATLSWIFFWFMLGTIVGVLRCFDHSGLRVCAVIAGTLGCPLTFAAFFYFWFSTIVCSCTFTVSLYVMFFAEVNAVQDIVTEYPWIGSWIIPHMSLIKQRVPITIVYAVAFVIWCYLAVKLYEARAKTSRALKANCYFLIYMILVELYGILMKALVAPIVGIVCTMIFFLLFFAFECGKHDIVWSCTKSASAVHFGLWPPSAPYYAGCIYAVGSLIHGLLITPVAVVPSRAPDVRRYSYVCIRDDIFALLDLLIKFLALLFDAVLDVAQSMLFFFRGQPFFGTFNLFGIFIQLAMLMVEAAQGNTQNVTFIAAVLQSDIIAHFRASWSAGVVSAALIEKTFREAFGETFLSMSIAIVSFFTMKFRFVADLRLMIVSICMSLNSIRVGVAEAQEYAFAEQEITFQGQTVCFQILPPNDFYARSTYKTARSILLVSVFRMAEGLASAVTIAVCLQCSSAMTTSLTCALISAVLVLPHFYWRHARHFLEICKCAGQMVAEHHARACSCDSVIQVILTWAFCFCLHVLVILSPVLPAGLLLFWGSCITVPDSLLKETASVLPTPSVDVHNWPTHLLSLTAPNYMLLLQSETFVGFVAQKCILLSTLWSLLIGSALTSKIFIFDASTLLPDAITSWREGSQTDQWQVGIQVCLMACSICSLITLIIIAPVLHHRRSLWEQQLKEAMLACTTDFDVLCDAVRKARDGLNDKGLLNVAELPRALGHKRRVQKASIPQLLLHQLMKVSFGAPDRKMFGVVRVLPEHMSTFIANLRCRRDTWQLETDMPALGLEAGLTLASGYDIKVFGPGGEEFGQPVSGRADVRNFLVHLSNELQPDPAILVLFMKASDRKEGFEATMRQYVSVEEKDVQAPSALAAHAQIMGDRVEVLGAPVFDVFTEWKKTLEQVRDHLHAVARYCSSLTLYHHMKRDEELGLGVGAYNLIPSSSEAGLRQDTSAHELASKLIAAVEAAPGRFELTTAMGGQQPRQLDEE